MTDTPPPSALREIRAHLGDPVVLAGLAGATVIMALSGPFRTLDHFAPLPRTAYWAAVVFGTYAIGTAVMTLLYLWPRYAGLHPVVRVLGSSLVLGAAVAAALVALDAALALGPPPDLGALAEQLALASVISAVVLSLREVMLAQSRPVGAGVAPGPPAILARLPVDRRGPLLALSAEDHYVRVITTAGESLVLIRLADAMREAGDGAGLQVHRSHWVARDAVRAVRRTGETAVVTLANGREVPVSRRFVPALRQAGLVPQRSGGVALAGVDHL